MGLEIINKLRKDKGLTSEQLSNESGVPIGTLNKILNGQTKNPAYETVLALSKALDCSVDIFDDSSKNKCFHDGYINLNLDETKLLDNYNKLNDLGKKEANKRVAELTCIPIYSGSENAASRVLEDMSSTIAAHDDNLTLDEKAEMDKRILDKIKGHK